MRKSDIKIDVEKAKLILPRLIEQALMGETVVLTRSGKPLIELVPVGTYSSQRPFGLHAHKLSEEEVAESIRPLSDEDLGFWQDDDFPK